MCLRPITLDSNAKFIPIQSYFRSKNTFACGQCAECQCRKSNEWQFRITAESEQTFLLNGYIYSDCLTYSEGNVPRLGDFFEVPFYKKMRVFNYVDVRDFLKRLRVNLERDGYDVDENLRYFYASEYGEKENGTHRPHYHILFFIRNNVVPPLVLSQYVSEAWTLGRTEGVKYKGSRYALEHNTITNSSLSLYRVSNYVAKYLEKDSTYFRVVISKIARIIRCEFGSLDLSNKAQKARYKELYNRVRPFHRQSLGFGSFALGSIDLNEVFERGTISFKVPTKSFVKHIPLPLYYKRKLFYEVFVRDKQYIWSENELGKEYKIISLKRNIKNVFDRLCALREQYNTPCSEELASYIVLSRYGNKMPIPKTSLIEKLQNGNDYELENFVFGYNSTSDKDFFGKGFISATYIGNSKVGYNIKTIEPIELPPSYVNEQFEKDIVIINDALKDFNKRKENNYTLMRRQRILKSKLKTKV